MVVGLPTQHHPTTHHPFLPGGALGISAKYLSSSRLLALQLRDATFRRHFLLQALILLQFLQNPRPTKQAWAALKGRQLDDAKVCVWRWASEAEGGGSQGRACWGVAWWRPRRRCGSSAAASPAVPATRDHAGRLVSAATLQASSALS